MENIENLEIVKIVADTNFKKGLMINTKDFYDKDFLQTFCRSSLFVCKLKT